MILLVLDRASSLKYSMVGAAGLADLMNGEVIYVEVCSDREFSVAHA